MTEPIWPTVLGGTVTVGGITWKAIRPWSATDAISGVLASANPASIDALNGHYNQYELEAADGTLATTAQATVRTSPLASSSRWAATADSTWRTRSPAATRATRPGNTSIGRSCTPRARRPSTSATRASATVIPLRSRSPSGSSRCYARNLHSNTDSAGEQWAETLGQYFATAGAYDVYDEKVMEETTFYGLPFWHFGTAPVTPLSGTLSSVNGAKPLTRASGASPTTASASSLSTSVDPITGTPSATVSFPAAGDTTQSQFGLYRPILPITSQEVTSSTGPATGLWIKALSSADTPNVTPRLGYPTIDLSRTSPRRVPADFLPVPARSCSSTRSCSATSATTST